MGELDLNVGMLPVESGSILQRLLVQTVDVLNQPGYGRSKSVDSEGCGIQMRAESLPNGIVSVYLKSTKSVLSTSQYSSVQPWSIEWFPHDSSSQHV